jgi:hypothetical protein
MRLEPLYRAVFRYPESFGTTITGEHGSEGHYFFVAEGRVEGRVSGALRASNRPRSRIDGCALPDVHGAITTDDGATVICTLTGFARPYPAGRRQIVCTATHVCGDERYAFLNDVVCVGTGEIRPQAGGGGPRDVVGHTTVEFVVDVAELVWDGVPD